jgi:hypothetical protein
MNPHDSQIHFCTVVVVMGHQGTLIRVEVDRPAPGEELNTGAPTEPRAAATVIVLRGGDERLEVLLVQRNPAALVEFSRWITPPEVQIRFDTLFLLAAAPENASPQPDGGETVAVGWHAPRAALEAFERGELELVFPTIKTLEQLSGFGSASELLGWAAGRVVEPIEPKVVIEGEVARVVLPGEPGYRD